MMYETSFLPVKRFPDLTKEDLEQAPMYTLFRDKYQAIITRANERFKAVTTTEDEAKRLKMSTDEPSLLIERVTFEGTNVIEYTVSIARGDKFSYSVELK